MSGLLPTSGSLGKTDFSQLVGRIMNHSAFGKMDIFFLNGLKPIFFEIYSLGTSASSATLRTLFKANLSEDDFDTIEGYLDDPVVQELLKELIADFGGHLPASVQSGLALLNPTSLGAQFKTFISALTTTSTISPSSSSGAAREPNFFERALAQEDDLRIIAQLFGSGFITGTCLEGGDPAPMAKFMEESLATIAKETEIFSKEEIAQLTEAKPFFNEFHSMCSRIDRSWDAAELASFAKEIIEKISNLKAGESVFIPGGSRNVTMMFAFRKQENGQFTLTVFNSMFDIKRWMHDLAVMGNRYMLKPVIDYVNLPEEEVFILAPDGSKSLFIQALLEPLMARSEEMDVEYVYLNLLNHLETYREAVVDQTLSGFITAQLSNTSAWKICCIALRLKLSKDLYKKALAVIKAKTLFATWDKVRPHLAQDETKTAQTRELMRKCTQQFCRNIVKIFNSTAIPQEKILDYAIKAAGILTSIEKTELDIREKHQQLVTRLELPLLETYEYSSRTKALDAMSWNKRDYYDYTAKYDLPPLPKLNDAATFTTALSAAYIKFEEVMDKDSIAVFQKRAYVDALALQFSVANYSGNDVFWDKVSDPEICLQVITKLSRDYLSITLKDQAPTFDSILTMMTFYTTVHRLTARLENQMVAFLRREGKPVEPMFQNFPIFNPGLLLRQQRFLFTANPQSLDRLKQFLEYFDKWNAPFGKERMLFDFTEVGMGVYFNKRDEKRNLTEESLESIPDFKLYDHFVTHLGYKEFVIKRRQEHELEGMREARRNKNINPDYPDYKKPDWWAVISPRLEGIADFYSEMYVSPPGLLNYSTSDDSNKQQLKSEGGKGLLAYLNAVKQQALIAYQFCTYQKIESDWRSNYHYSYYDSQPRISAYPAISEAAYTFNCTYRDIIQQVGGIVPQNGTQLPKLSQNANSFIVNRPLNTRCTFEIQRNVSEAMALGASHVSEGMESILFHELTRTAAEPKLQPSQVIYAFRRQIANLGAQPNSRDLQVLLILLFFKTMAGNGSPTDPLLFSSSINQLETQESLRKQVEEFVNMGLDCYWNLKPGQLPDIESCLFFIQFAQRARLCLKNTPMATTFMAGLEERTLDVWLDGEGLSKQQEGNIHLHRIHGYLSYNIHQLQPHDISRIASSWVFMSLNPPDEEQKWPEMIQGVENYYYTMLIKLKDQLQGDLLQEVCASIIKEMGLNYPENKKFLWEPSPSFPVYRRVTRVEMKSKYSWSAPEAKRVEFWEVDLMAGVVTNEAGKLEDTKIPDWVNSAAFRRLFGSTKYQYKNVGGVIYFTDPKKGEFRVNSKYSYNMEENLEWQHNNEWCHYITPLSLNSHVPDSLLAATHLWKMKDADHSVIICQSENNRPIGFINSQGRIMIREAHLLEGAQENDVDLEIRSYSFRAAHELFSLALVDESRFIEQRYHNGALVQIALPRYCSRSRQPMVFDVTPKGTILWRHDPRFELQRDKQQRGLLPAVENYLLLTTKSGHQRKLIVPCQPIAGADDFSPLSHIGLNVRNAQPYQPLIVKKESADKELNPIGMCQYLEYRLDAQNRIVADKADELLFLAYLYLQQREYGLALATINKVEKVDLLTPVCYNILRWMVNLPTSNHDSSPSAIAVCLHGMHKYMTHLAKTLDVVAKDSETDSKKAFKSAVEQLKGLCAIPYEMYVINLEHVEKRVELSVEQELDIIRLLAIVIEEEEPPRKEGDEEPTFAEKAFSFGKKAFIWIGSLINDKLTPAVRSRFDYLTQEYGDDLYPNPRIGVVQPYLSPNKRSLSTIWKYIPDNDDSYLEQTEVARWIPRSSVAAETGAEWPSTRRGEYFFWINLKIALQGSQEERRALLFKLQLFEKQYTSNYKEQDDLLTYLVLASESERYQYFPFPNDDDSLHDKAMWFKNLLEGYNNQQSGYFSGLSSSLSLVPAMLKEFFVSFYLNRYQIRPNSYQGLDVGKGSHRFNITKDRRALRITHLKSAPWNSLRGASDMAALKLGGLISLSEERYKLYGDAFVERVAQVQSKGTLALAYDLDKVPKEEIHFKRAIKKEYEDFMVDFTEGRKQVLSKKSWDFSTGYNAQVVLEVLLEKRDEKQAELDTLEQGLLTLANSKPEDLVKRNKELLYDGGGLSTPLELPDLVYLFLKKSHNLFEAANPTLKDLKVDGESAIATLYQQIGHFLWKSTELQTIKRAIELCEKINKDKDPLDSEYHTQQLTQELSAKRFYQPSERPEFLVFEYCSDLIIRENQVELLEKMLKSRDGKYADIVVQLIMGGGKTSVLASLLCQIAAKPGRISLFITPASQFETVKENLKHTQRRCYNQPILALDFQRKDLQVDTLEKMKKELNKAIDRGELVLMKVECLQMLELEMITVLRYIGSQRYVDASVTQKCQLLRDMLLQFRSQADAIIDEVDIVLNALQTVNFPDGESLRVASQQIELMREIFMILASDQIMVGQRSMKQFVRLQSNQQTLLKTKDIAEKISPVVAGCLADHYEPLMLKEHRAAFIRYVTGEMNTYLQKLIGENGEKVDQLSTRDKEDLKFLRYLRQLHTSADPQENDAADLAALAKHVMRTLLPVTLAKSGGRQYGRTRKTPAGKVVPYLAVDTPATTEFGYHFEALAYQFQTALQFGITRGQVKMLADNLRIVAENYVRKTQSVNFDDTPEAKEFLYLTGIKLSAINQEGNLDKATANLKEDIEAGNVERLLRVEAETAVNTVTYHQERIESTAQQVICQVDTRRAFSGTPWNSDGYHPSLSDAVLNDVGTEGQIAYALLERMEKKELTIHIAPNEDPGVMLRTILQNHPQRARVRGFMDAGGVFKKTDNETVARAMLEVLKQLNPEIKGILFFYRPEGKATADTLALLKPGLKQPVLIEGTSYNEIMKTGIDVSEYFVYYDDRHTTGTDILQVPSAINLVTVDETLLRRTFFQSVLRLRQFFFSQTVELVIPQDSQDSIVGQGETIEGIIESTVKNQAIHKSKYLFRCYKQMMDNIFRQEALKQLFNQPISNAASGFKSVEPFLVGKLRNTPYENFGHLEAEVEAIESLRLYRERLCSLWNIHGQWMTSEISDGIDAIIARAQKSPVLQSHVLEGGMENLGVEQEVSMQVQQEVQEEVEMELEQELQEELHRYEAIDGGSNRPEKNWTAKDWEALVKTLQNDQREIGEVPSVVKPLQVHMTPHSRTSNFVYDKPYPYIFNKLLSTEDFVFSRVNLVPVFNKTHRPANQILIVKSKAGYQGLLLSDYEAELFKGWKHDNRTRTSLREVWLVQPDGSLLVDSQAILPQNEAVKDLLIESNAFNGNADFLEKNGEATRRWLEAPCPEITSDNPLKVKTDFLKLRVERNPVQRLILQNDRIITPKIEAKKSVDVEHIVRMKHDRMLKFKPEDIAKITDERLIHELRDDQVQYVSPAQVTLLATEQYRFLRYAEQLAAIPKEKYSLDQVVLFQIQLLADWQVNLIRGDKTKLHQLTRDQVDKIDSSQLDHILPEQISWLTEQALLRQIKGHRISFINPELVNQLLDHQLCELNGEQIHWLTPERLHLLTPSQLVKLSRQQVEENQDKAVENRLGELRNIIVGCIPEKVDELPCISYLVCKYLPTNCLPVLRKDQVQQFDVSMLDRLSDGQLPYLTVEQLQKIEPSQAKLIQRLNATQLLSVSDECLVQLTEKQVQTIDEEEEMSRLPTGKLGALSLDQLGRIGSFDLIKRLPGESLHGLGVVTMFNIPYKSLKEFDQEKLKHCTFFQKLVLSVHMLAVAIISTIPNFLELMIHLPRPLFGYAIWEQWDQLVLSLQHFKWSVTIWLPAS